ncbi:MAG: peptidoglycan DD-metalloendopeptidase family protein [Dysgonamonadaceae bacterium]|jgi:LysM repeat protein|nr:peptidoglycan DD-metalloendopeptidase family protein [Dysgonamonadaceae bacterium]
MDCFIKKLLVISLGAVIPLMMTAAIPSSNVEQNTAGVPVSVQETKNGDGKTLVADAIDTPQLKAHLDEMLWEDELDREEEMFPADDLYGLWDSERVNPYATAVIPDTFSVDVSTYVAPTEGYVTSPFGPRKRRFHNGIDLKVQVGDTIRAAFDGKVRVQEYQKRGYGYYLVIRHNNGLETIYAHLSDYLVESEETVKAGQPIALGGNTGRSTGSHLHFETRFLGMAINPASIIDFNNHVPHNDVFVYNKTKSSINKYQNGSVTYHRVKTGDTLGKIAQKHGVSINTLCRLNNIKPNKVLRVGTTLRCS